MFVTWGQYSVISVTPSVAWAQDPFSAPAAAPGQATPVVVQPDGSVVVAPGGEAPKPEGQPPEGAAKPMEQLSQAMRNPDESH